MALTNDHTVKAFDEDLNRLRGLISEMGGRAEQALLQRFAVGAVDRDERTAVGSLAHRTAQQLLERPGSGLAARVMDRAREQLAAGARLAAQEDTSRAADRGLEPPHGVLHRGRAGEPGLRHDEGVMVRGVHVT